MLLVTLACGLFASAATAQVPSDRRLQPDVFAYASAPSVPELKARWNKSSRAKLLNDPALADVLGQITGKLDELAGNAEKELGVKPAELLAMLEGEVSIALLNTGGNRIAVTAFLDFGKQRKTVDALVVKLTKAATDKGAVLTETMFQGTQINTLTPKANGNGGAINGSLNYFIKDTHIVLGSDRTALEAVLVRWDGKHERTLADNQVYSYIAKKCRDADRQPALSWFVDPVSMIRTALTAGGGAKLQTAMILDFLPQLGVEKLKGIGGSYDLAAGEFDTVSRAMMYVETPTTGVIDVFRFPAKQQVPPNWVAADIDGYLTLNWDVDGAFTAIEKMVDSQSAPGTLGLMLDSLADSQDGPGFHPKKDLIDNLSGKVHLLSDGPTKDDDSVERMLVAFELKDAAKAKTVLAGAAGRPGVKGKPRQFQGETIYEIAGGNGAVSISVAAGHLLVSSDAKLLEGVIQPDKKKPRLMDAVDYKRYAAQFPGKTSILSFQRQDTRIRSAYEALRTARASSIIPDIDFGKLPPFDVVSKYLSASASYAIPDARGAYFFSYSLTGDGK
jgi:hypothetical protein